MKITYELLNYGLAAAIATSFYVLTEPAPYDVLMFIVAVAFFAFGLKIPLQASVPVFLVGMIVVGNLISIVAANEPLKSVPYFAVTLYLWLTSLFIACVVYNDPLRSLRFIWFGYTSAAIISAAFAYLGYFHIITMPELLENERARGFFEDPNVFAPFLYPVIFFLIVSLETPGNLAKVFKLLGILFISGALFISFSRSAWISLILGFFILLNLRLFAYRSERLIYGLISLSLIIMLLGGGLIAWMMSQENIGLLFEKRAALFQSYDIAQETGRFSIQKRVIGASLWHPFGLGPDNNKFLFERAPHNNYLYILLENGWLSLACFLSFILLTITKGFSVCFSPSRVQPYFAAAFTALIVTLAQSLVIDSIHWRHFYVLVGLVWGVILLYWSSPKKVLRVKYN